MPPTPQLKGKPIQVRPSVELRLLLDREKKQQRRSLNNLIIIILEKYFRATTVEAGHAQR
jgi:hypothetical protein